MEQFFKSHPSAIWLCVAAFLLGSALFSSTWGLLFGVAGFIVGNAIDAKRLSELDAGT